MKHTIVSDTCCLIDLHKAGLLTKLLSLPYTCVIPNMLFEKELPKFSPGEKEVLIHLGLKVHKLDSNGVYHAAVHKIAHPILSIHDCSAMRLAEEIEASILLTGDKNLRTVAEGLGIEVHGVLWVADEFDRHAVVPRPQLADAMRLLLDDSSAFLPKAELVRRIKIFEDET